MGVMRWRMRAAAVLLGALLGVGVIGPRAAWADPAGHAQRRLTVASYNLYLGADLTPLFSASSPQELVQLAGQIYANVVRTDFPSRAEAIARLLAASPPDVAGLQEVSLWETGPIGGPLSPSYDFLRLLLAALARHGLSYRPVAVNVNFAGAPMPISATTAARLTDRDVIIARSDLPAARLKVRGPESHNFAARLVIPTAIPGLSFTVLRGWSAVDVKVRGRTVRFANTHLEAFSTPVRKQQAQELAAALARSAHPVVLVGDLNSTPDDTVGAYGTFAAAGYADAWVAVQGPEGGFTAGQTELLDNVPSKLDHRIDYVLYQPLGVRAVAAEVIGEELADRTPAGLWPSDHAGVVATLDLAHP
ncbi:MAG TPA: endonuclease/exonuclease/phosphatase family protein [Actinomycetes bacterium]|jgi:endonuclease/exonuclease/phosphatase family metal-dependent hydrolase|nr:endonuclease/exonuclease/phosphatase family protein [Actinomycetes bacterium]